MKSIYVLLWDQLETILHGVRPVVYLDPDVALSYNSTTQTYTITGLDS